MANFKEIDDSSCPETVNHNIFLTLLKYHFHDIYEELEDGSADLLHVVMGNLRNIVEQNLSLRERKTHLYFDFLSKVLERADKDVINAIQVSFLYGFPENKADIETASNWMPNNLKDLKRELRNYLSDST
ncbi:MAG: hypothetical protein ACMZ7B_13825 [Balneola sp.]